VENEQKANQNEIKKSKKNESMDASSKPRLLEANFSFIREKIIGGDLIISE